MGKIRLLSAEVVKCIAAGEVIENPASVVKELVENSIDADASSIHIEADSGGLAFIKVKDNGKGIAKEDLKIALERHSSSKISSVEDVYNINTMGFRGEALYSIAAVSKIVIASKEFDSGSAWKIVSAPGEQVEGPMPCPLNVGTEVVVKDLFFNLPARKKFLKSDRALNTGITNMVSRYALLFNDIEWRLVLSGKEVFYMPVEKALERTARVLGVESKNLMEINAVFDLDNAKKLSVKGFISNAKVSKPRRTNQFIYVNNRPVVINALSFRINDLFKPILGPKKYPVFVVNIEISPNDVDVNIHPTKQEVKFRNQDALIGLIARAVGQAVMSRSQPKQAIGIVAQSLSNVRRGNYNPKTQEFYRRESIYEPGNEVGEKEDVPYGLVDMLNRAKVIGVALNKYALCQSDNSILIIDIHAAVEKVNYERLIKQIEKGNIEKQNLTSPVILRLSPTEMVKWSEIKDALDIFGFTTTLWSDNEIAVHSAPVLCKNIKATVSGLLIEYKQIKNSSPEYLKEKVASMACRRSIMAGDKVSLLELNKLVNDLLSLENPFSCPHGRPAVVELNDKDLEKLFERT